MPAVADPETHDDPGPSRRRGPVAGNDGLTQSEPSAAPAAPARLVVLAGPTAVGKGTVVAKLRELRPDIWVSVSATTRPPRPGEIDGVHYRFVDPRQFDAWIDAGQFLEWAVVHGLHRYGTLRQPVTDQLDRGDPALLEIDLQGARQVRRAMPDALFVFLAPPSIEELMDRQHKRNTETPAEQRRRLVTARAEIAAEPEFDEVIVNRRVGDAAAELVELIETGRTRAGD